MSTPHAAQKACVFRNGRSQAVRIPASYRFSSEEVFIRRDAITGVISLSEEPFQSQMADLLARLDDAGAIDFVLERDLSPPEDRELF